MSDQDFHQDSVEQIEPLPEHLQKSDPFYGKKVRRSLGDSRVTFYGTVEEVVRGQVTREKLYLIRYEDQDVEHVPEKEMKECVVEEGEEQAAAAAAAAAPPTLQPAQPGPEADEDEDDLSAAPAVPLAIPPDSAFRRRTPTGYVRHLSPELMRPPSRVGDWRTAHIRRPPERYPGPRPKSKAKPKGKMKPKARGRR